MPPMFGNRKYRKWFINEHMYKTEINSNYYQKVPIPEHVVKAMVNLFPKEDLTWVVLFDPNFVEYLLENNITTKDNIIFVADDENKAVYLYGMYETVFPTESEIALGLTESSFIINTIEFNEGFSSTSFKKLKNEIEGKNMKFEKLAVIGNPPYQKNNDTSGETTHSSPIYQLFVEGIIDNINPNYLSMIIPSRWMVGGRGLDSHRNRMINDSRIKSINHFPGENEIFETVSIKGGVNYFMWDNEYSGKCSFTVNNESVNISLNEYDIVIQDTKVISILNKVILKTTKSMNNDFSVVTPFGIISSFNNWVDPSEGIICYSKGKSINYINVSEIKDKYGLLHKWKVCIPKTTVEGSTFSGEVRSYFTKNSMFIIEPNAICTQSYIVLGIFDNKNEAEYLLSYIKTKFFRFMLGIRTQTQDITRDRFSWVPDLKDYSKEWTDSGLYAMFDLTDEEIQYIESKIKAI